MLKKVKREVNRIGLFLCSAKVYFELFLIAILNAILIIKFVYKRQMFSHKTLAKEADKLIRMIK